MRDKVSVIRKIQELLPNLDRTIVVDIGANPTQRPPYRDLMQADQATVIGFEPDPRAYAELDPASDPNVHYVNAAVGDGKKATLHVCAMSYMTSLLCPDPASMAVFPKMAKEMEVIEKTSLQTKKLDSISEIKRVDLLKIDVQGSELTIFQNGRKKLADAVCIQTEVAFFPIYLNQPTFGDIDSELRSQGFLPHDLPVIHRNPVAPYRARRRYATQLLDGDFIYLRDFRTMDDFSDQQLCQMAVIGLGFLQSADVTVRALNILATRGQLTSDALVTFVRGLNIENGRFEL